MFVGLFGAKKVGGTSDRPKKEEEEEEDVELDDILMEGPFEGFWVVGRKDVRGV